MTNQEIKELITLFENSSLSGMKLAQGDFSMELNRTVGVCAAAPAAAAAAGEKKEACAEHVITAPLVGTYYAAPAPGKEPFVSVGDRVKKGQTVCLIEAMKMISEIPAPCDGVITEVLKENGALAAFQEPLFCYEPC